MNSRRIFDRRNGNFDGRFPLLMPTMLLFLPCDRHALSYDWKCVSIGGANMLALVENIFYCFSLKYIMGDYFLNSILSFFEI